VEAIDNSGGNSVSQKQQVGAASRRQAMDQNQDQQAATNPATDEEIQELVAEALLIKAIRRHMEKPEVEIEELSRLNGMAMTLQKTKP